MTRAGSGIFKITAAWSLIPRTIYKNEKVFGFCVTKMRVLMPGEVVQTRVLFLMLKVDKAGRYSEMLYAARYLITHVERWS